MEMTLRDVWEWTQKHHGLHYIYSVYHSQSVLEAALLLLEHHILSIPVLMAPSIEDDESDTFMGIVDVRSILLELSTGMSEDFTLFHSGNPLPAFWNTLSERRTKCQGEEVICIANQNLDLEYTGNLDHSLQYTILHGIFAGSKTTPRHLCQQRICIFDSHGTIPGLISQLDLLNVMHTIIRQDKSTLWQTWQSTTAAEALALPPAVCLGETAPLWEVLQVMLGKKNESESDQPDAIVVQHANGHSTMLSLQSLLPLMTASELLYATPLSLYLSSSCCRREDIHSDPPLPASSSLWACMEYCLQHKVHHLLLKSARDTLCMVHVSDLLRHCLE